MNATSQMAENPPVLLPSVKDVLRRIWRKHACKRLAEAARVPVGTAKDWLQGRSCPRADDLLLIALRDADARAEFQRVLLEIGYAERRLAEMARYGVFSPGRDVGQAHTVAQPARRLARTPAASANSARRAA